MDGFPGSSIETKAMSININGKEEKWFTSTMNYCTKKKVAYQFHSGKFGEFMKSLSNDELFFKTIVVDGKVYYSTEEHAKEAVAARWIDSITSASKHRNTYFHDETLVPLRYCVEMPLFLLQNNTTGWSASPQYDLISKMQQQYGPVDVTYEIKSEQFEFQGESREWYSATCFHPITNEGFDSGVFVTNGAMSFTKLPLMPTGPIALEEIQIRDNRVYYKDEEFAKHAAAARALDCLNYRNGEETYKADLGRMCIEEPYAMAEGIKRPIEYGKIQKIVEERRLDTQTQIVFGVLIDVIMTRPHLLHVPRDLYKCAHDRMGRELPSYELTTHNQTDGKPWITSSVTDPMTGEVFHSGLSGDDVDAPLMQGAKMRVPLSKANVKVINGEVYYENESLAKNAAAARAIDNYLFRGDMHRSKHIEAEPRIQLCMEDPYATSEERDAQHIDYTILLDKRAIRSNRSDNKTALPTRQISFNQIRFNQILADVFQRYSYQLHVPMSLMVEVINRYNRSLNQQEILPECNTTKISDGQDQWCTSTLVNPITGEEFCSGLVGKEVNVPKAKGCFMRVPLHEAEVKVVDGKVYYRDNKLANHAAAARALDCYFFRRAKSGFDDDLSKIQLCMEDPYSTADERDAQHIDYTILQLLKKSGAPKTNTVDVNARNTNISAAGADFFDKRLHDLFKRTPHHLHVPMKFLENYSKYSTASISEGQDQWHTSTVAITKTGEEFCSGLVGEEVDVPKVEGSTIRLPLHEAEVKVVDGKVYYRDSKLADHAAAARALDCLIFRRAKRGFDDDLSKIQLCMEDPYSTASEMDTQKIDYESLLAQRSDRMASHTVLAKDFETYITQDASAVVDEDDTYEIMPVNPNESAISSKLSTMGRIAEIWTNRHDTTSQALQSAMEELSPRKRLDNIMAWYERVNKSPRTYDDAIALSNLCKRVLAVLAECNTDAMMNIGGTNFSTTKKGQDIWNQLCSLQSEFSVSFLDTNACNNYIRCLVGSTDHSGITTAEALLMGMMKGVELYGDLEVTLPSPNVDTYNAVMTLWSKTDILEAKKGVNRVYALLEDAFEAGGCESELQPNIDTFKILAAINSKTDDGAFSLDRAKDCLEKMRQLSEKHSLGDSILPDVSIYNAALSKRNFASNEYNPAWLWNGRAFDGGFADATESSNNEGSEVEAWCRLMNSNGIIGDINTFEEVIQTWIDTGTFDGLVSSHHFARIVLLARI
eukprot:scaffold11789_cov38-Cyclotella_meneghiniana.AAC.1